MDDLSLDQVVGEVQETSNEGLVLFPNMLSELGALSRWVLENKSALGTDRHDHGVLCHLGLHQAQHFRPEVVRPVTPANPPPGHPSTPQMDSFHVGRAHKDLEERAWIRHDRNLAGIDLEGDARVVQKKVGPHGGLDDPKKGAQSLVLGQGRNRRQLFVERRSGSCHRFFS